MTRIKISAKRQQRTASITAVPIIANNSKGAIRRVIKGPLIVQRANLGRGGEARYRNQGHQKVR